MPELTPEQRVQRARRAVLTRWSRTDEAGRTAATEPARQGLRAKFAREIDPDGTLPPAELERRIGWAMKAHMTGLALQSSKARAARKSSSTSKGGRHAAA